MEDSYTSQAQVIVSSDVFFSSFHQFHGRLVERMDSRKLRGEMNLVEFREFDSGLLKGVCGQVIEDCYLFADWKITSWPASGGEKNPHSL